MEIALAEILLRVAAQIAPDIFRALVGEGVTIDEAIEQARKALPQPIDTSAEDEERRKRLMERVSLAVESVQHAIKARESSDATVTAVGKLAKHVMGPLGDSEK